MTNRVGVDDTGVPAEEVAECLRLAAAQGGPQLLVGRLRWNRRRRFVPPARGHGHT
jgi:hypothetical protein